MAWRNCQCAWLPLTLIAVVLLLYVLMLPGILNALVGLPFMVKLLVSAGCWFRWDSPWECPSLPAYVRWPAFRCAEFPAAQKSQASENAVEWAWAMNAGIQRDGLGFGDGHRYSVWAERHAGLRRGGLSSSFVIRGDPANPSCLR